MFVIVICVWYVYFVLLLFFCVVVSLYLLDWFFDYGVGIVVVCGEMVNCKVCCWCGCCEKVKIVLFLVGVMYFVEVV